MMYLNAEGDSHRIQLVERGRLDWTELYCTVLYCTVLYRTVLLAWFLFSSTYKSAFVPLPIIFYLAFYLQKKTKKHSSNDLVCQTFGVLYNIYCSMSGTGNGTHYNMYKSQLLTAVFIIMLVLKNAYITLRKQLFVICLFIHSLIHLLFVSSFIHTYQNKITRNLNYPVILFTKNISQKLFFTWYFWIFSPIFVTIILSHYHSPHSSSCRELGEPLRSTVMCSILYTICCAPTHNRLYIVATINNVIGFRYTLGILEFWA